MFHNTHTHTHTHTQCFIDKNCCLDKTEVLLIIRLRGKVGMAYNPFTDGFHRLNFSEF